MCLTSESLTQAFGTSQALANLWYPAIMDAMHQYRIDDPKSIPHLVAQMAYETQSFSRLRENLNYRTPERVLDVFGKYVAEHEVEDFVLHPVKLANRVYANRMGNGSESSNDGWNYRGGGGLMLTGKNNYRRYSLHCGCDLVTNPNQIEQYEHAAGSAAWYWMINDLSKFAAKNDFRMITRIIVGSPATASARKAMYDKLMGVIS